MRKYALEVLSHPRSQSLRWPRSEEAASPSIPKVVRRCHATVRAGHANCCRSHRGAFRNSLSHSSAVRSDANSRVGVRERLKWASNTPHAETTLRSATSATARARWRSPAVRTHRASAVIPPHPRASTSTAARRPLATWTIAEHTSWASRMSSGWSCTANTSTIPSPRHRTVPTDVVTLRGARSGRRARRVVPAATDSREPFPSAERTLPLSKWRWNGCSETVGWCIFRLGGRWCHGPGHTVAI